MRASTLPPIPQPSATKPSRSYEPVEEFSDDPAAVLYVQIDRPDGASPLQVAAGRDRALGQTVLVVRY